MVLAVSPERIFNTFLLINQFTIKKKELSCEGFSEYC